MSNLERITDFLKARRATFFSSILLDKDSNTLVFEIPVENLGAKARAGITSKRQLSHFRRQLMEKFGVRVVVIFRDSQQLLDIESGLRGLLRRNFQNQVSDVYISFPVGEKVQVWISLLSNVALSSRSSIADQANNFLVTASFEVGEISFLEMQGADPSNLSILRAVKLLSPAKSEAVMEHLVQKGFSVPSERWLKAKFDGVRKKGLIVRNGDGSYVLSAAGINLVPHSRSRSSTDVERMLLLARFKGC